MTYPDPNTVKFSGLEGASAKLGMTTRPLGSFTLEEFADRFLPILGGTFDTFTVPEHETRLETEWAKVTAAVKEDGLERPTELISRRHEDRFFLITAEASNAAYPSLAEIFEDAATSQ